MGYQQNTVGVPYIAASAINEGVIVGGLLAASAANEMVVVASSAGVQFPIGFALATAASPGNPVSVQVDGIAKAICAAGGSIRAGMMVAAGSGGLAVEFTPLLPTAGNPVRFYVGVARQNAVAGDRFAVHIQPGASI